MTEKTQYILHDDKPLNDDKETFGNKEIYLQEGTVLNERYKIIEVIGEGGFGITYSAMDTLLKVKVAIKEYYPTGIVTRKIDNERVTKDVVPVLNSRGGDFLDGKNKVIEEARRMAQLRAVPGIVTVFECFEANSTAYIVMDFIEGCTLKKYCENCTPTDRVGLINQIFPIMDALSQMHKLGIIHRDISPDNIMIDSEGRLTLLDFGAARTNSGDTRKNMTIVLKKNYAPEEQFRETGIQGPATDVYALGATMYEIITGNIPPNSLDRVYKDEILDLREVDYPYTYAVKNAVMIALNVKYSERWQSMEDFAMAMYDDKATVGEEDGESEGSNKTLIIVLISIIAVLILLAISFVLFFRDDEKEDKEEKIATTEVTETSIETGGDKEIAEEEIEEGYFDREYTYYEGNNVVLGENNDFMVYDFSYIYYFPNGIDGEKKTLELNMESYSCYYSDGIFYIEGMDLSDGQNMIYAYNPQTDSLNLITNGESIYLCGVTDNKLYIQYYGEKVELLTYDLISQEFINRVAVDDFYFTNIDENRKMFVVDYVEETGSQYIEKYNIDEDKKERIDITNTFRRMRLLDYRDPYALFYDPEIHELNYYNSDTRISEILGMYYSFCIVGNTIYYIEVNGILYDIDLTTKKINLICDLNEFYDWGGIMLNGIGLEYMELNGKHYIFANRALSSGVLKISLDEGQAEWLV